MGTLRASRCYHPQSKLNTPKPPWKQRSQERQHQIGCRKVSPPGVQKPSGEGRRGGVTKRRNDKRVRSGWDGRSSCASSGASSANPPGDRDLTRGVRQRVWREFPFDYVGEPSQTAARTCGPASASRPRLTYLLCGDVCSRFSCHPRTASGSHNLRSCAPRRQRWSSAHASTRLDATRSRSFSEHRRTPVL